MNEMRPLSHTHGEKEPQSVGARGGQRGILQPWHMEDVLLFLSDHGDSEPIYLWRNQRRDQS
jgi:hypothetical protein